MSQHYEDRLKVHLAAWKRAMLAEARDEAWTRAGPSFRDVVPSDKRHLNLLAGARAGVTAWLARQPLLRLRRDFHRLDSSQAMALNLFWPAVATPAGRAALAQALGCAPIASTSPLFESIPDPSCRTAFDLHLYTQDGGQLLFELRLGEHRFAETREGAAPLAGLDDVRLERLQARVAPAWLSPEPSPARRLLLRALAELSTDADRLFLIAPQGNHALLEQAADFAGGLAADVRGQVVVLPMETLVQRLRAAAPEGDAHWDAYYAEFLRKYAVTEAELACPA